MPRHQTRLDWTWNDARQEFRTPAGRIVSLHEIAQLLADHRDCRFDFAGPWTGWRMRGAHFVPTRGRQEQPTLKPDTGRQLARWIDDATETLDHRPGGHHCGWFTRADGKR